MVKEFYNGG